MNEPKININVINAWRSNERVCKGAKQLLWQCSEANW